jgi:hypothetical protein
MLQSFPHRPSFSKCYRNLLNSVRTAIGSATRRLGCRGSCSEPRTALLISATRRLGCRGRCSGTYDCCNWGSADLDKLGLRLLNLLCELILLLRHGLPDLSVLPQGGSSLNSCLGSVFQCSLLVVVFGPLCLGLLDLGICASVDVCKMNSEDKLLYVHVSDMQQ